MFLDYYQMREQPFGVSPDPQYLYLGKSHREALASLFYGIESDRGFVALIAQPGLGKTTLTFQLLAKLERTARSVFLFQTQCNSRELLHYVLNDLGVDAAGMDIISMNNKLNVILSREKLAGRRFVLAIDEAQNLDADVLETIRLLSNFETPSAKLLQILLIGQPQLARKLASPALVQLQQRISVYARLEPLDSEETQSYVAHRLKVAGYSGSPLFTPGALRIVQDWSQGIPRNINSVCFDALSLGCAMDRKRIDSEILREVIADRDIESLNQPLTPRAVPMAGPVLSYPRATSKPWFPRWALGAACLAASVAVGLVMLPSSSRRIGRFLHAMTEVSASVRKVKRSTESSRGATPASGPISALAEKPVEIPAADSVPPVRSNGDVDTKVVARNAGNALEQTVEPAVRQPSDRVIEQIRQPYPAISNPNRIEAGQKMRLSPPSLLFVAPPVSRAASTTGRN